MIPSLNQSLFPVLFHEYRKTKEESPVLTEEEINKLRSSRYVRGRTSSVDYSSQGRGSQGFEQTPEQALYSKSLQLTRTIQRFQYEAPSWVPNLLQVQDTQNELNSEVRIPTPNHTTGTL